MSYTTEIKEEISYIKESKSELIAELSGYIRNNSTITEKSISMTTENIFTINKITDSVQNLYNIKTQVSKIENLNFSKNNLYQITIYTKNNNFLKDIGVLDANGNYLETVPEYIVGSDEEIRSYLRGVFSCSGSINDPKKSRYHMELLIFKPKEAIFIQKLLNMYELNAKIISRDKGYMIYIKEAEKISDFIKLLGANKAVMYYENIRVYHEQKNKTNRLNNCEQANIDKVIQTALIQIEQIKIIEENDGLKLLDDKTKESLYFRKKYPEASLKELAEIISNNTKHSITKSGLNHRLRKIKELAEKLQKLNKKEDKD